MICRQLGFSNFRKITHSGFFGAARRKSLKMLENIFVFINLFLHNISNAELCARRVRNIFLCVINKACHYYHLNVDFRKILDG